MVHLILHSKMDEIHMSICFESFKKFKLNIYICMYLPLEVTSLIAGCVVSFF